MIDVQKIAEQAGFEKSYYGPNFTPGIYAYNMDIVERFATLIREAVVQELVAGSGEPVAWAMRPKLHIEVFTNPELLVIPKGKVNVQLYTADQLAGAVLRERERILNLPQIKGNLFAEKAIRSGT